MPFGQMPVLEVDGYKMAQTVAICNYLAREFGLGGKTSLETASIDQVVCLVEDFFGAFFRAFKEKDETRKAELLKAYRDEEAPKYMGMFEKLLQNKPSGYFVGDTATLADIFVFEFMWSFNARNPGILDNYPALVAHQEKVGSIPRIKAYLAARKHTDM
ncbi:glutathione S-transferase [Elysia marginata]|uniref:Glutathione S-transferase n=1 Tax=Elysia marginata TaxID=1093978 RepID=A0AAV4FL38_9GAST|nr:glutathione S-transferase [Elysia marginata]